MVIKPNKNGVVTGTKKSDKITWLSSKDWAKALTVNAGDGNDVINFKKSKYKNKLNGDAGNDIIYGGTNADTIKGGLGNDKLYGYNGNDKIYGVSGKNTIYSGAGNDIIYLGTSNDIAVFNKGDGIDTVVKGKGKDSLQFTTFKNITALKKGITATKTGNDLILTYTTKDKVKLYNYFKSGSSVAYLKSKDNKYVALTTFLKNTTINIKGKKIGDSYYFTGTDYNDVIKTSGEGNVNGGKGANTIYVYKYSETDITSGGGIDTIVIDKKYKQADMLSKDLFGDLRLNAHYLGKDLLITPSYSGDMVVNLKNYTSKSSVKNIEIAGKKYTFANVAPVKFTKVMLTPEKEIVNGTQGRDEFTINSTYYYEEENERVDELNFGNEIYTGKGNDLISYNSLGIAHFKPGDGHDAIDVINSNIMFDNENDIDDLNISVGHYYEEYETLINIKYNNNEDMVTVADSANIFIGNDIYILRSNDYYYGTIGISENLYNKYIRDNLEEIDIHLWGLEGINNNIILGNYYTSCYFNDHSDYDPFNDTGIPLSDIKTFSGNDYIEATGTVYAGGGDDTIFAIGTGIYLGEAGNDKIYTGNTLYRDYYENYSRLDNIVLNGGDGDDTYYIDLYENMDMGYYSGSFEQNIEDTLGNEVVNIIHGGQKDVYVNIKADQSYDNDLLIAHWVSNGDEYWVENCYNNRLKISEYLDNENRYTINYYDTPQYSKDRKQNYDEKKYVLSSLGAGEVLSVDTNIIDTIKETVASFLTTGGFTDCNDVFNRGTETQINDLIAKFDGFAQWNEIAS